MKETKKFIRIQDKKIVFECLNCEKHFKVHPMKYKEGKFCDNLCEKLYNNNCRLCYKYKGERAIVCGSHGRIIQAWISLEKRNAYLWLDRYSHRAEIIFSLKQFLKRIGKG